MRESSLKNGIVSCVCDVLYYGKLTPEHPLESDYGHDHQALEEERQTALATCKAAIHQTNSRDDQPDEKATNDEVDIVEFVAAVLGVDIINR